MDIQTAATNMSRARVQEQAAVQVQAMGISAAKEQGAALAKLLESASAITDPNVGQLVDVTA